METIDRLLAQQQIGRIELEPLPATGFCPQCFLLCQEIRNILLGQKKVRRETDDHASECIRETMLKALLERQG